MKLYLDTSEMTCMVSKDPAEKADENGKQRSERGTGRPLWVTQVFIQTPEGGEVITVTTAGEKPNVGVGEFVSLPRLEAIPWVQEKRNGTSYRAEAVLPNAKVSSVPKSA